MVEPEKPFACSIADCGMTFTNEDHLHVHTKKHDMVLQLGMEQKAAFVADQTPTPTRFIRNCEEVGLFLDLQSENPFDEGFKRAMETAKHGLLSMEHAGGSSSEDLHTPQMVFPMVDHGDSALYSATNNQRNITISRSSSDESGVIKEYETTTISKLTNEVTTISRRVEKHDLLEKTHEDTRHNDTIRNKDILNETSVSYTNNIIKIRKDVETNKNSHSPVTKCTDSVIKDVNNMTKDVLLAETNKQIEIPPIMSQKSYDFVVDSLTSDLCTNEQIDNKNIRKTQQKTIVTDNNDEYSVTITLPDGRHIRMKSFESGPEKAAPQSNTKEKLKMAITNKLTQNIPVIQNVPIATGTFFPVTILNPGPMNKIPIAPLNLDRSREIKRPVKKRRHVVGEGRTANEAQDDGSVDGASTAGKRKLSRDDLDSRVAASRRYRQRLKHSMEMQENEIKQLKDNNKRLIAENATLKILITEHMKTCPSSDDLRIIQENLVLHTSTNT
ncbi:activating transcription factor-2 [Aphomia sociella]